MKQIGEGVQKLAHFYGNQLRTKNDVLINKAGHTATQARRTRECRGCHAMPCCLDSKVVGTPISSKKKKRKKGGGRRRKKKKKKKRKKEKRKKRNKWKKERKEKTRPETRGSESHVGGQGP